MAHTTTLYLFQRVDSLPEVLACIYESSDIWDPWMHLSSYTLIINVGPKKLHMMVLKEDY